MGLRRVQLIGLAAAALLMAAWLGTEARQNGPQLSQFALRPEFHLEEVTGRTFSQEDVRGKFALVFFGFTRGTEVCPTTLAEVGEVLDALGAEADQVRPLFISIDYQRDEATDVAGYATAFHPGILGLTGSPRALRAAAVSFGAFYGWQHDSSAPEGHVIEHSSSLFLLGPRGEWLRAYPYGTPASEIVAELSSYL